ncbi:MAG: glycosyltransferase [Chitinophagaceae bacterium]|nr:glycosyltransferase [Chitinophagaceae bacterium]
MAQPLITVYITNYNYGRFIQQAVDSVLAQTCQDFELLIIDDGSTDDSLLVIESYRNHPKISIILQKNKGLNATNNVAMHHARGKYLIRLDADDFFDRAALGVMSAILEADDELGLVFPDYHYVDGKGERIGSHRRHLFDDEVTLYDQPAHGACTMIRLAFLRALGGYDESFTCQDGYELWVKFVTFHKVTNVNRPLFFYRQHNENLSTDQSRLLSTRKLIKAKFVQTYLNPINTLFILPIRLKQFSEATWPLFPFQTSTVLGEKIDACLNARSLAKLVLVCDCPQLLAQLKNDYQFNERVLVMHRPVEYASQRAHIRLTIDMILSEVGASFDGIAVISPDYPFVDTSVLDEVVDTLNIFQSDAVITVNAGKGIYYRHNGQTLKPILELDQFTVYEREVLYNGAGGVMVSTMANYLRNRRMISDRVAHVLLDFRQSFGVSNEFNFQLFKHFTQS